jgi:hypothetical protein
MAITKIKVSSRQKTISLIFERVMALIALANLSLVVFDLSYVPLRTFWLQGRVQLYFKIGQWEAEFPEQPLKILPFSIASKYDWVKGIEPNRDTEYYLERVDALEAKINQLVMQEPQNPSASGDDLDQILGELRELSIQMIDSNPFQIAEKTGTLEKIKNIMRDHVFDDQDASSREAFSTFWSKSYLQANSINELEFFQKEIRPLIASNYYRPIGENGDFVDNFGLLDLPFFFIFLVEFLARTWYISRRHTGVSWFDAALWRWYDVFFLIPLFRWLRVIPVVVRLSQAKLIDLHAIQKQASQGFVASIAEDLTEVVLIRLINQVQGSIKQGEITQILSQTSGREYIDLNDTNEIAELVKLMAKLTVNQVLPKIQTDVENIVKYNLNKAIDSSPAYSNFKQLPGVTDLQTNIIDQVTHQLYQTIYGTLVTLIQEDPTFDQLIEKLVANFTNAMGSEMQAKESLDRMESLLVDLLEEVKVNYIERLSNEDVEDILEQTRKLRQVAHNQS